MRLRLRKDDSQKPDERKESVRSVMQDMLETRFVRRYQPPHGNQAASKRSFRYHRIGARHDKANDSKIRVLKVDPHPTRHAL
jgi:hypothetical protein